MRQWRPCWIVTMLLLLGSGAWSAQTEDPQFEFVSVRRVPPACGVIAFNLRCEREVLPRSTLRVFPGGRLEITNQAPIDLVRVAYGLERLDPKFLSGGPGWLKRERYDVIALTGADGLPGQGRGALTEEIRLMLRGLLEDRFKLRVRTVPKKTEVFVLSRSESLAFGPGLTVSSGSCLESPPGSDLPECATYAQGRIAATNISMADLADVLSRIVNVPVIDETGIDGRYDVRVELAQRPEQRNPDRIQVRSGAELVNRDVAAVAASLRRDLGLDWRRATRVLDRIEIRDAERPVDD